MGCDSEEMIEKPLQTEVVLGRTGVSSVWTLQKANMDAQIGVSILRGLSLDLFFPCKEEIIKYQGLTIFV